MTTFTPSRVFSPPACTVAAALVLLPASAGAQFRFHVDGSIAAPVGNPQQNEFALGGGGGVAAEYLPLRQLGLITRASALALSPYDGPLPEGYAHPRVGTLEWLGIGLRTRPFAGLVRGVGGELWVEITGGVGLTGRIVRPIVSARAGIGYRAGVIIAGPWFGYTRVFDVGPSVLPGDAQIVSAGVELSLAVSRATHAPRPPVIPVAPRSATRCGEGGGDGCAPRDRDGDTIVDERDRCPDVREDFDGFEDGDGCPETDNDRDDVADRDDACPNDPETTNGVLDTDGCPDEAPVEVVRGRIEYNETIQFAFDSVRILPGSDRTLRAIAQLLVVHGEYGTVFIEGHADEIGADDYNDTLSFARARAVIEALARLGVPRARMTPIGFGRRQPLDRTNTPLARARTRRVEFVVDGHRSRGRALTAGGYVDVHDEVMP
jgi:outer membrane protein OmpA-like peptidoglycan-associated protein